MNTEKLKQHECRFCKHFDGRWCELKLNECAYQWPEGDLRPENLPIAWELHPDIAYAITEAIKLEKDTMKQWLLDEGYEILSEKI